MSISYVTGIPAATNNPSVDQPNMLINTNSINTYVGVDHVGFNVGGGAVSGQHLQVTFNSNNVPATPTTPPVLFTNTIGGVAQLFFYSGSTFNQYVNSSNGSTYMLGGMIIKWGSGNMQDGGGFVNNFAVAFPNACYSVIVQNTNASYTGSVAVTAKSTTSFTAQRLSGTGITGILYIAVGY